MFKYLKAHPIHPKNAPPCVSRKERKERSENKLYKFTSFFLGET
jgi:hypothetical protein